MEYRWLSGPEFFEWIVTKRPYVIHPADAPGSLPGRLNASLFGENTTRSVHRWKDGSLVDSYGYPYSHVMNSLNLQEWEIPNGIWKEDSVRPRLTSEQRHDIVVKAAAGVGFSDIARVVGCDRRTVDYWVARA